MGFNGVSMVGFNGTDTLPIPVQPRAHQRMWAAVLYINRKESVPPKPETVKRVSNWDNWEPVNRTWTSKPRRRILS